MKKQYLIVTAILATAVFSPAGAAPAQSAGEQAAAESRIPGPAITWQEAMKREGQTVTVEARIVGVFDPEARGRSGPVRLNTDRDFRNSLNIVFFKRDRSGADQGFGDPQRFEGRTVRVRGRVTTHREQMQLTVSSPNDIEVVDAAQDLFEGIDVSPARSRIPGTAITWQEAMEREGQTVTVEAQIVNVFDPESRGRSGPVRLNTDRDHRDSLNIIFHKRDRSGADQGFGDPDRFRGKTVRVRGRVTTFRDQMQLTVRAPDQIEIID